MLNFEIVQLLFFDIFLAFVTISYCVIFIISPSSKSLEVGCFHSSLYSNILAIFLIEKSYRWAPHEQPLTILKEIVQIESVNSEWSANFTARWLTIFFWCMNKASLIFFKEGSSSSSLYSLPWGTHAGTNAHWLCLHPVFDLTFPSHNLDPKTQILCRLLLSGCGENNLGRWAIGSPFLPHFASYFLSLWVFFLFIYCGLPDSTVL